MIVLLWAETTEDIWHNNYVKQFQSKYTKESFRKPSRKLFFCTYSQFEKTFENGIYKAVFIVYNLATL